MLYAGKFSQGCDRRFCDIAHKRKVEIIQSVFLHVRITRQATVTQMECGYTVFSRTDNDHLRSVQEYPPRHQGLPVK